MDIFLEKNKEFTFIYINTRIERLIILSDISQCIQKFM